KIVLEFEQTPNHPLSIVPVRTNLNRELSYKQLENLVEIRLNTNTNIDCYFIITFLTHSNNTDFIDKIESVISENTKNTVDSFEVVYENSKKIHIINYCKHSVTVEQAEEFSFSVFQELVDTYTAGLFLAVSKPIQTIDQLADEIKYLTKSMRFVLIYGFGKVITHKEFDIIKKQPIDATKHILYISNLIMDNQVDAIQEYINNLFNIELVTPENIDELAAKILILIDDIFQEFNLAEVYKKQDLIYSITTLYNQDNIDDMKCILLEELNKITSFMHTGAIKYNPIVKHALRIIQKQYNENLSLKMLAQLCNINPSYLGQLLYKEVGESFSDFLNKVRNDKAKELILTTDMKISDIAEKIGYTDSSYFYRKFKKYHGVCPSTLRQIKN
ncbi:MAG: helix-turn-helix domain-containing protein, partial [Oscillospiraceae bacterium]